MARGARPLTFWLAVGGISVTSLALLNLAADRLPLPGLDAFRDYVTRANG